MDFHRDGILETGNWKIPVAHKMVMIAGKIMYEPIYAEEFYKQEVEDMSEIELEEVSDIKQHRGVFKFSQEALEQELLKGVTKPKNFYTGAIAVEPMTGKGNICMGSNVGMTNTEDKLTNKDIVNTNGDDYGDVSDVTRDLCR